MSSSMSSSLSSTRLQVFQFPAREDNYAVILHDRETGTTIAIDAPELEPIADVLEDKRLTLTHILTTHHHPDHVAANKDLKAAHKCTIIGPAAEADRIPGIDEQVSGGDMFAIGGHRVEVIPTPGHTLGQVAYHFPDQKLLFAADALFALGCGRLFEGTPEQMHKSLQSLAALPDDTQVYAGHEYTLSNAKFAVTVDPENEALAARKREIEHLRDDGKPTLPTTIAKEKETNPFLRPHDANIRKGLGMEDATDVDVFAQLRSLKDAS